MDKFGYCEEPLKEDGPSLYFCGSTCQTNWSKPDPRDLWEYRALNVRDNRHEG